MQGTVSRISRRLTVLTTAFVVASGVGLIGLEPAAFAEPDRFPTDGPAAMALYESDPDTWAEGPTQYLMLREERELWSELSTTAERRAFIDWFWTRRDDDLRDRVQPFRASFYERVAEANRRFSGFPRGWKSDRGRVWTVLGRPDSIRGNGRGVTIWTYFTRGRDRAFGSAYGEVRVGFVETGPGSQEIIGDLAVGIYPFYLRRALEYTRQASIVNPDLELAPVSR